ncbi:TraB/GumN family protein [Paenibacillus soyae]|uniref:TraB/GumN family protein n=1 Tax=Paenibacillus soyae TaxID=2969249 RepID=A0A9X2MMA1_9BACL|nr:TraB/GumN family protein [Paenibacillus soyae]MCR2804508.1 TraB/GumN family protein [Paenibacillus soyae]
MKKLVALFVSLIMALGFATAAGAAPAASPLEIYVNDKLVEFKEDKPVKQNGTTLVPVRMLLEQLDFEVTWDQDTQMATAISTSPRNNLVISLQIGSDTAYVNAKPQKLLLAPQKINQRTYVPLRFIVEQSGYEIEWNEKLNRISIDTIVESKGYMWKVEKDGNVVYLLGSIHVANEAMYPLRDEITEAFEEADYLAVEVNTSVEPEDLGAYVEDLATYKDGTTLRNHLSPEVYAALGELLTELEIPTNALDTYEPWYVSMILDSFGREDSEYESELGIDLHFMNEATDANVPIMELESYQSQFEMFDNFSDGLQEQFVIGSLYSLYGEEEPAEDLSEMWIAGDVEELTQMAEDMQADLEYYNAMLKDRNILMAEKVNGFLTGSKPATFFVVVGALHMVGEHGLVALLEEMGYTVTRL